MTCLVLYHFLRKGSKSHRRHFEILRLLCFWFFLRFFFCQEMVVWPCHMTSMKRLFSAAWCRWGALIYNIQYKMKRPVESDKCFNYDTKPWYHQWLVSSSRLPDWALSADDATHNYNIQYTCYNIPPHLTCHSTPLLSHRFPLYHLLRTPQR